jgi:mannan endo-1,4-beta-mannosidase
MAIMKLSFLALVSFAAAAPTIGSPQAQSLAPMIGLISQQGGEPLTSQILQTFLEPFGINLDWNSYIYRDGSSLKLNGEIWTASGANIYWLGFDENAIPPAGSPFYAPFNASYPTHGRITEIMNTLVIMGAKTIRSQTIGVSVGNPLSVMPALGLYNEQAFDTIDWSVYQARPQGLRIMAPLVDNYVSYHLI